MGLRPFIAAGLIAIASLAHAQAIVHPHVIRGTVSFSNVNPEVRAEIDRPSPSGGFDWLVTSTGAAPAIASTVVVRTAARTQASYEMVVESSDDGIDYAVTAEAFDDFLYSGNRYAAGVAGATVARPAPAPDSVVDLVECATLVRVSWIDAAGAPVAVSGGEVTVILQSRTLAMALIPPGSTSLQFLAPGSGQDVQVVARYTSGTDVMTDLLSYERRFFARLDCDAVVTEVLTTGESFALGRATGRFDVVGETEVSSLGLGPWDSTTNIDMAGPWGNERITVMAPPSGDFALENLVPSSASAPACPYQLATEALLDRGGILETFNTTRQGIDVPDGATLDLGDDYVMTPAYISIDEVLVGPPSVASPGGACLEDVIAGEQFYGLDAPFVRGSQPALEVTSMASVALPGGYDPATGSVTHACEIACPAVGGGSAEWTSPGLDLFIVDRSNPASPAGYRDAWVGIDPEPAGTTLAPGARVDRPLHLCFGQLYLDFIDVGGTFTEPYLSWYSSGRLHGDDFEGVARDHAVRLMARGTPLYADGPSDRGLVVTALPEGDYDLRPGVYSENPGGGTTLTELHPLFLHVGCRQVITATPQVAVSVRPSPCVGSEVQLDISVDAEQALDSVTWSVNGLAEHQVCAPCAGIIGSAFVPLSLGESSVKVTARDVAGHVASTTSFVTSTGGLDPGSLRMSRVAGGLRATWSGATSVDVLAGTIDALRGGGYDHHAIGACGVTGGAAVLVAPEGGAYFIAGETCASGSGMLGADSLGRPIPPGSPGCN